MLEKLSQEDKDYVLKHIKIDLEDRSEEEIKIAVNYILERKRYNVLN